MKTKTIYRPFPDFVLRTPLLPLNFILPVITKKIITNSQLKKILTDETIREAILLASPDLFKRLEDWEQGFISKQKEINRIKNALVRYLIRMSMRCTPFGLFAGVSTGTWGNETEIHLPPCHLYERSTRLDMNYLFALSQYLTNEPQLKKNIKYFPNSSLYRVGHHYRYVEYRYNGSGRTHHLVSVDYSEYLELLLKNIENGLQFDDIVRLLVNEQIPEDEVISFVNELIDNQVIVGGLKPAVTQLDMLDKIINALDITPALIATQTILKTIRNTLRVIDEKSIGKTLGEYAVMKESMIELGLNHEHKFLFQTDLVKTPHKCLLDVKLQNDIQKGLNWLVKLTPKKVETTLDKFFKSFLKRYNTREVPLVEALDEEMGIGYNHSPGVGEQSPLLNDIAFRKKITDNTHTHADPVIAFLHGKLIKSLSDGATEIDLSEKDYHFLENKAEAWPETFAVFLSILSAGNEKHHRGTIYLHAAGGTSAANMLSRFCHANNQIHDLVKQIVEKEQELLEPSVLAEIVHLPEARTGNILLRPALRDFEIPYLAESGVDQDHRIYPSDLMLSVKNGRFVIRSKKLNREIIPRLTTAHNYSKNALPLYQFLCDFQSQNIKSWYGFSWGSLLNTFPFLPRITFENLIFSPAIWNIQTNEIIRFVKIKDDDELVGAVRKWRVSHRIPPLVSLVDNDNELLISLENINCLRTLFSIIKGQKKFRLAEFLFDDKHPVVHSIDGQFTNEFILPFYKSQ
ncbi:MAG: lantibiotic dehydratase family protein [Bacteroidales bacterium]|nr:lantibiotic dehydratase family protein [Bacteroidales bacterium]